MANILAEAMYSRCNEESRHIFLLDDIIDHVKTSQAVEQDDQHVSKTKRYTILLRDSTYVHNGKIDPPHDIHSMS